jgi:hypothetical protein
MVKLSPFATRSLAPNPESPPNENDDDVTVEMAANRAEKAREMKEFCVKWVFPLKHDGRQVLRQHWNMLGMMFDAFPDIVVIGNGSNNNITNCQEFETKNECKPSKQAGKGQHFRLHNDVRNVKQQTTTIIHRFRTIRSLKELKSAEGVIKKLQEEKAYVRLHAFSEIDVHIAHLGFVHSVNPYHTPAEHVKQGLLGMLHQDQTEVPNFEIVKIRVMTENARSWKDRVEAYEVQCAQQCASTLAHMLRSGSFANEPIVIPYYYRKSQPKMFQGALNRQRRVLLTQYVIKVDGISPAMAPIISEAITLPTIIGMVPSPKTHLGEWRLLVDQSKFQEAMKWLHQNWNEIVESIPDDLIEDSPFDHDPRITSRLGKTRDDPYSSDKSEDGTIDSYGTLLSALFEQDADESIASNDSNSKQQSKTSSAPVSYAKVARQGSSSVSVTSAVTSPTLDIEFRTELGILRKENEELKKRQAEEARQLRLEHEQQLEKLRQDNLLQLASLREDNANLQQDVMVIRDMLFQMQGHPQRSSDAPSKRQAVFETPTKRKDNRQGRHVNNSDTTQLRDSATSSPTPGEVQEMEE